MTNIILIAIYLFCSVGGLTLVKVGANNNGFQATSAFFNLQLSYTTVLGLLLYIASFIMWIVIVQKFNLSYIQPLTAGLSYILILAASLFILKESIGMYQWIGIGFILVGVILMNLQK
ncbi:MAG: hypothetical protein ACOYB8_00520 [Eubacteriaceae bacterium]|jgi:multidrug transporter EmrE-like cation transporter